MVTIVDSDHEGPMDTARLFQSGRSQAVRLPKDYRFQGQEVAVKHYGNGVLLLPIDDPWQTMEAGLAAFESGFELRREQPDQQKRDAIQPIHPPDGLPEDPSEEPADRPCEQIQP